VEDLEMIETLLNNQLKTNILILLQYLPTATLSSAVEIQRMFASTISKIKYYLEDLQLLRTDL
jgi:hypothetical protein